MSYSQNDEETIILAQLERAKIKQGRFLDIGAWDGKTFSNTLRLAELGWSGVCVEPSPSSFVALMKVHQNNDEVILVNAAVSAKTDWLEFWDSNGDAVSSSSKEHVTKWRTGSKVQFTKFMLKPVTIDELFTKFGSHWDFINLDVEGLNFELFQGLPWVHLDETTVICVEHDGFHAEMEAMASKYGFIKVSQNAENLLLSRPV